MSRLGKSDLSESQFECDKNFNQVFASATEFQLSDNTLLDLRKDCMTVLTNIAEKYESCSVEEDDDHDQEEGEVDEGHESEEASRSGSTIFTVSDNDSTHWQTDDSCSCTLSTCPRTLSSDLFLPSPQSNASMSVCSDTSSDLSSAFIPDCDVERDDTGSLYGDQDNLSVHSDDSCTTDSQYSCFGTPTNKSSSLSTNIQSTQPAIVTDDDCSHVRDNLICPGDVVEYKHQTGRGVVKRNSIVTIHKTRHKTFIVLKNGTVLRPKKHFVRKVKMFCGATEHLIPNPLAEWFPLETCVLQHGSLVALSKNNPCSSDDNSSSSDDSVGYCSSEKSNSDGNDFSNESEGTLQQRRPPKKGGKKRRLRTSEGLTNNVQTIRMRKVRRENKFLDSAPDYPNFSWADRGSEEYYDAIDAVNLSYRKMLKIGKAQDAFRDAKVNVSSMLNAKSKGEFNQAKRNIDYRFDRHVQSGKGVLKNFNVRAELLPNPKSYANSRRKVPTRRQTIINEEILTFEQYLSTLNIFKCTVCLECHIEAKALTHDEQYQCAACVRRKDPNFFIDNNLHPIWYLRDNEDNFVLGENNAKIPQYHIPPELSSLTVSERLLIRRCANFVPCVHLKNGVFGVKGHCVTFPQDITDMCDELPLAKDTVLTFLRNIANKDTNAVFPTTLKVNRERLLSALKWLKRHNPFYKNIRIVEANLDWMNGQQEANICTEGIDMNLKETASLKKREQEEEFVSSSNKSGEDFDDSGNDIQISTAHANTRQKVPSGRQAAPIREFIDIAKQTNQTPKIMNFPPIDHDSPIRYEDEEKEIF